MTEKREKITSFDALRAYSCLMVMAYHAHLLVPGYSGLSTFFVMSGFLCVYNYYGDGRTARLGLRESLSFSLKKIKKLYPLHLVMLIYPLLTQTYGLVHGLVPIGSYISMLTANALLVHAWIPLNRYYFSYNIPSWFLSAMMFIYFVFPLVLRRMEKYRSRRTAFLVALGVYLLQIASSLVFEKILLATVGSDSRSYPETYQWFIQVFPVYRLGDFVIGGNLAYIFMHREEKELSPVHCTVLELAAVVLVVLAEITYQRAPKNTTCIFMVSSAVLVYAFALSKGYIARALTNKVVKHLAALSSDIYLIHFPVLMVAGLVSTNLPLDLSVQKLVYVLFTFCGTYCLSLISQAIRKKYRRFT